MFVEAKIDSRITIVLKYFNYLINDGTKKYS